MKGKFYFPYFCFGHSCFVFIPLTRVKYFPPVCYFLLNFLSDFFLISVSTFCFTASGFGMKVVARDLALILLNV